MKDKLIVCPRCGYQYLPSEIFIPNTVFGKPSFIRRSVDGKIENVDGEEPDMTELYCCDNCNTSFKVSLEMSFDTQIDVNSDFEHDYVTPLKSNILLDEN